MNDRKDPLKKTLPGSKRKPPASLFLWLLAFLVLASLIVFNSSPYFSAPEEWTANTFLAHLEKGEIVSAEIMPESDKILAISGEFKTIPKDVANADKADAGEAKKDDKPAIVEKDLTKPSESGDAAKKDAAKKLKLKYTTRIYATDSVIDKLEEKGVQTVYLERDVWWKSLLLNLAIAVPILLVFYFIFTRQIHGAGSGAIQRTLLRETSLTVRPSGSMSSTIFESLCSKMKLTMCSGATVTEAVRRSDAA